MRGVRHERFMRTRFPDFRVISRRWTDNRFLCHQDPNGHLSQTLRTLRSGEGEVLTEVSPASGSRKTATLPTKRSTTTLVRPAAAGSTATWSGRGSRETTPTRSPVGTWDFQFKFKSFLRTFSVNHSLFQN